MRKSLRFLKAILNGSDHIKRNVQLQMNNQLGCLKKTFKTKDSLLWHENTR